MASKRLGFLILTSSSIDSQILRLFDRLSEFDNAQILVHHDAEQAGVFPEHIRIKYNIYLVKPTYRTYWSHINNVLATLDGLKLMYDQCPKIDWFITITPSCYPIKPINFIQDFYDTCDYDALIDMHQIGNSEKFRELDTYLIRDFKTQPWFKIPFLSSKGKFYWKNIRKRISIRNHPFLSNNIPYQGSNWFSINRFVVQKIIDQDVRHGELVQFYQNYIKALPDMHPCPQETILPTFIANISNIKISNDSFRYINWDRTTNWSPNTLDISFWHDISISNAHWARKLQSEISDDLRLNIDHQLLNVS